MITLTPLSASASSSSSSEPICYLLEVDGARILLDMGQRDFRANAARHDWGYEEAVRELAPTLSLVLLSHSSNPYLGLYPFARAHWGLTCPVYATQPTVEMGRVVCLAEVESWRSEVEVKIAGGGHLRDNPSSMANNGESSQTVGDKGKQPLRGPFVPTVEEVHEAFDWIKPIRYHQPLHLGGDLSHLLLTSYPSGHTLGGTLFKIRSPTSGTALYALGINHTSERHLDGIMGGQGGEMGYDEGLIRPDLLIVEAGRGEVINPKRKDREAAVLDVITSTLESSRSVLVPTDPSPRLLELLVLLDQHWSFKQTSGKTRNSRSAGGGDTTWNHPLCVVSRTALDMLSFARSLIEWMGGMVRDSTGTEEVEMMDRDRERKRGRKGRRRVGGGDIGSEYGALDFKNIQFFATPMDLLQAHPFSRPKVVLAVPPSMSHGPSRWLLTAMASTEGNVILLTSRGEEGSLARELFDTWEEAQAETAKWGKGRIGNPASSGERRTIEMNSKVPLVGAELDDHLEAERLQKEREAATKAATDRSRRMLEADDLDDDDSDSGSEDGAEDPDGLMGAMTRRGADLSGGGANANAGAGDGDASQQMSFDIFVKGQQMRNRGLGGEAQSAAVVGNEGNSAMARFRMFPFVLRMGRKVDDYGEGLDVGQWVRKGREIEEEGETEEVREAKRRKVEEDEKKKAPPEPPSKYITEQAVVEIRASVFYVDMEGLHDGQAIKTIISDIQPRKLILVRSSAQVTQSLLSFFSATFSTKDIFAPSINEPITIGEHVQSYSLNLGDSISSTLASKWAKFEGYEVQMIEGRISLGAGSTVPTLEAASMRLQPVPKVVGAEEKEVTADIMVKQEPEMAEEGTQAESGTAAEKTVDPLPTTSKGEPLKSKKALQPRTLPSSLFVGDLRLAQLKSRLNASGIPAEFAGEGVLICGPGVASRMEDPDVQVKSGSIIAVRKVAEGEVVVEGCVGKVYFDVRKEVYGSLALVAAA